MADSNFQSELKRVLNHLRDPVKLRIAVTALMLAIGYAGIYMPMSHKMDETKRSLDLERKRQALANDVDYLRTQVAMFQERLPEKTDTNEWVQYVVEGTRQFPLELLKLDSGKVERVGPYQAVALHVDLKGRMKDLDAFMNWVETNDRLFRVNNAKIEPARGNSTTRILNLTLLGLRA